MSDDLDELFNMLNNISSGSEPEPVPFENDIPKYAVTNGEEYLVEYRDGVPVIGCFENAAVYETVDEAVTSAKPLGYGWMVCEVWEEEL